MRIDIKVALGAGTLAVACLFAGCESTGGNAMRPRGVDLYVQGVQASQSGNQKLAQVKFEQATSTNPNLRMARAMLGDMYRSQGEYERAREQYEALTRLDPYSSENLYRLGVTYQFLQRVQDAIASYLRALEIEPRDVKSCMNLGLAYLTLNQKDDAVKYLRRATELSPDWPDAWANLGVALDAQNKLTEAEDAYKKALELDRNQNAALLNLGANLIRQGKGADAVSVMEEAVKRMDNAPTHTRYGHALSLAGRFDDAMKEYDRALELDPRYYPALNERGSTLIAMYEKGLELDDKPRRQAIESWKKSLAIYPNQPPTNQSIKRWSGARMFGPQ